MFFYFFRLKLFIAILIPAFILSSCGDSDDVASIKTENLTKIYSLYKFPKEKFETINCSNASGVLKSSSKNIKIIWFEKLESNWNQYNVASNFCSETKSFVKSGICNEKQKDTTKLNVEVKSGYVQVTNIYPEHPSCSYKFKINLKIDTPVEGEKWSSGKCQYPQPKESQQYLVCTKL